MTLMGNGGGLMKNNNNIDNIVCKGIKVWSIPLCSDYFVSNVLSDMFDTWYSEACNLEIV